MADLFTANGMTEARVTGPVEAALEAFRASGSPWLDLPFFREGAADRVAQKVDARVTAGATVLYVSNTSITPHPPLPSGVVAATCPPFGDGR